MVLFTRDCEVFALASPAWCGRNVFSFSISPLSGDAHTRTRKLRRRTVHPLAPCSPLALDLSCSTNPLVCTEWWGNWGGQCKWRLPWWLSDKETACQYRRRGFSPWVGKIPWRRKWQPTLMLIAEKFHRHRSLVGTVHGVAKRWMRLRDQTTAV